MKLSYGFLCDYCKTEIPYTEKISIKYESYKKSENYDRVKSFDTFSKISLDLCPKCFLIAHKNLERKRSLPRKNNAYLEVRKYQKQFSEKKAN